MRGSRFLLESCGRDGIVPPPRRSSGALMQTAATHQFPCELNKVLEEIVVSHGWGSWSK